ncbi:MAG TPA: hypothetical protein VKT49_23155 [Bryobacteraceae bacterium]|nr:hypothetical protein [Bryobacteraceae bacterium]
MKRLYSIRLKMLAPALLAFAAIAPAGAAPCTGPGAPTNTETKCLTAIPITGSRLTSFDISFVNPQRGEYYLGDRSTKGVDIIDTRLLKFVRTAGLDKPFQGIVLTSKGGVNNPASGPAGVAAHGRWLYAGDGNSTLHVIDLEAAPGSETKQVLNTGGSFRVDEMALTTDGKLLIAANNADDPSFVTLFSANGDAAASTVAPLMKITVDPSILPTGFGLGIEQPAWDPKTKRFYTSIPVIANNPSGCNYGQLSGPITCSGGLLVTDPHAPTGVEGAYDPVKNTGVIPLNSCGPNGATVGVHDNLLLGCTPGNLPGSTTTLVINATTHNYAQVGNITGSDEVWFNSGDQRYYTGSSGAIKPAGSPLGRGSVLGVIDSTSVLIETIPVSSGSHSVAADSERGLIFVPQTYTSSPTAVPLGDQNTTAGPGSATVGQLICGTTDGCIAVYHHGGPGKHKGRGQGESDDESDNE